MRGHTTTCSISRCGAQGFGIGFRSCFCISGHPWIEAIVVCAAPEGSLPITAIWHRAHLCFIFAASLPGKHAPRSQRLRQESVRQVLLKQDRHVHPGASGRRPRKGCGTTRLIKRYQHPTTANGSLRQVFVCVSVCRRSLVAICGSRIQRTCASQGTLRKICASFQQDLTDREATCARGQQQSRLPLRIGAIGLSRCRQQLVTEVASAQASRQHERTLPALADVFGIRPGAQQLLHNTRR